MSSVDRAREMAIPSRSRCDVPFAIFPSTVDRFARKGARAEAVRPSRGFLSERAAFAKARAAEGIVCIGPNPHAIEAMSDKIESKKFANAAKVSTAPDFFGVIGSPQHAAEITDEIGYPMMIKASAGGFPMNLSPPSLGSLKGGLGGPPAAFSLEFALGGLDLGDVKVEETDRIALELGLGGLVTLDLRQAADAVAPWRRKQRCNDERVRCGIVACKAQRQSSSGSRVCLRKATTTASSSSDRTVEPGSFGPDRRSATDVRFFHLERVLGSIS